MLNLNKYSIGNFPVSYFPITLEDIQMGARRKRVLFISAHPDDIEISCLATVESLVEKGFCVYYLICSDGEASSSASRDERLEESQMGALLAGRKIVNREHDQSSDQYLLSLNEQFKKQQGIAGIFYFHLPDTKLSFIPDLVPRIESLLRIIKPSLLFTHTVHDEHMDHKAVGQAVKTASYKTIPSVFAYCGPRIINEFSPNVFHAISSREMKRKEEFLKLSFRTQMSPHFIERIRAIHKFFQLDSFAKGYPNTNYCEAYEVIRHLI